MDAEEQRRRLHRYRPSVVAESELATKLRVAEPSPFESPHRHSAIREPLDDMLTEAIAKATVVTGREPMQTRT